MGTLLVLGMRPLPGALLFYEEYQWVKRGKIILVYNIY